MQRLLCTLLLSALLTSLAACEAPPQAIRIATIPWPGYELIHLADELGYFKEAGLRAEVVEFVSLTDARRAFERNQVDVWATTPIELLQNRDQAKRRAQAFLILDFSNGADVVLARAPIDKIADLRGKRIAAEPGTLDVVMLHLALQQAGMSLADVVQVPLPHNQIQAALSRGEVDAAVTYPPDSLPIMRAGKINKIFDSSLIPGMIVDVLAADGADLAQRPQVYTGLARGLARAWRYAEDHPEQAQAMMARRAGVGADDMRNALNGIRLVPLPEQIGYFGAGGRLEHIFRIAEQALLAAHMVSRSERWRDSLSSVPVQQAGR